MRHDRLTWSFTPAAAGMLALCLALGTVSSSQAADTCSKVCVATLPMSGPLSQRILGINYAGKLPADSARIKKSDLTGAIKMSGTWVSKLSPATFVAQAGAACRFAEEHGQAFYLQIPVTYSGAQVTTALKQLAAQRCEPRGFAIGNEVDRLVHENIVEQYSVRQYVADYNRILPLVKSQFPKAKIIALELASFIDKGYVAGDPLAVKYRPVFEWLLPFLKSSLVARPDYISLHYYPFTGAQRDWEALSGGRMFREVLRELAPYLADAPPLLVGEFNATYQYEDNTVFVGSGGDSFMIALTAPDLLATDAVRGVFHWSLMEPRSTLGLFQGPALTPVPLFHAYQLIAGTLDMRPVAATTAKADLVAYAFHRDGRYRVLLANTSPFFRRNVSVSGAANADVRIDDFCGCTNVANVTLAPLSITEIEGSLSRAGEAPRLRRFAYAERVIRDGQFSAADSAVPYCAVLADFSQQVFAGKHFLNERYDQNAKLATGGTPVALNSPGGRAGLRRQPGTLDVDCMLPAGSTSYLRCGVKLPLVTDAMIDRYQGTDWSDGMTNGSLRLSIEVMPPVEVQVHLESFQQGVAGYNHPHTTFDAGAPRVLDIPLHSLRPDPQGYGRAIGDALGNASALRVEVRQPGYKGNLRIRKLEICDAL